MKDCDTLLMLGTDFPYRQFFPGKARVAQVDIRGAALGNRCALDLGVVGTVRDTLQALLPLVEDKPDPRISTRPLPTIARRAATSMRWPKRAGQRRSSTRNTCPGS